MGTTYRTSRNIEGSLIQFIKEKLKESWINYNVEKTFARVYGIPVNPDTKNFVVCVRLSDTIHDNVELGSPSTWRLPLVIIDIFATNDGQRLDVKDYLIKKLKAGCTYYTYTVEPGAIKSKTADGRITVKKIADTIVDMDIDKNKLESWDKYRHRITLTISLGKVEI